MRRLLLAASLGAILLVSCAAPGPVTLASETAAPPAAAPSSQALPSQAATLPPRVEAIRFALVGAPTEVNAWELFSDTGAGYANYTLHAGEYPGLFRLSVPAGQFEPYIADGMPSVVTQDGLFYIASVRLREGLTWSDGSPLTANDVAFTVNTALKFHLNLDWVSAYDPEQLERAEASDDRSVEFFFKRPFNVGDWQYGALQGPILSQAYWSSKLLQAEALLPAIELIASLDKLKTEAASLQERINADDALLATAVPGSQDYIDAGQRIKHNQDELNSVNSRLGKQQDEYDAALNAARSSLFVLKADGEPTFGPYLRAVQEGHALAREANPSYPFQKPDFDRAIYLTFPDMRSALAAFEAGQVNEVLSPDGVPADAATQTSPTSSLRFLVFNPKNIALSDPALRRALACMRDFRGTTPQGTDSAGAGGFVAGGAWQNGAALVPCLGMPDQQKIGQAVKLLKDAGYSWSREPGDRQPGAGLVMPGGLPFPAVRLLAPSDGYDPERAAAATFIAQQANYLGIPLTVQAADPESVRYAVYSSGDYDMAVLGWRLGAYPGYLCTWFEAPGPFAFDDGRLKSACSTMETTADLETSRGAANEVQAVLAERLPFIPLYRALRGEAVRGVTYPFGAVLDGLSNLYGVPWLAAPAQ